MKTKLVLKPGSMKVKKYFFSKNHKNKSLSSLRDEVLKLVFR